MKKHEKTEYVHFAAWCVAFWKDSERKTEKAPKLLEVMLSCISLKGRMSYHSKHIFLMLKI